MDTTKKLLKNLPEHLLYFAATDIICLIVAFAVNLMLRPIVLETARGDAAVERAVEQVFFGVYFALFFVVLAVILSKSSIQRTAYLAATVGRQYSFFGDLAAFLKGGIWVGFGAYALFCLPLTLLMAFFPGIKYVPTLFYPQYSAIELCGPWIGYLLDLGCYFIFSLFLFPFLHLKWEKGRLHH